VAVAAAVKVSRTKIIAAAPPQQRKPLPTALVEDSRKSEMITE
jgi:hypothetical protein